MEKRIINLNTDSNTQIKNIQYCLMILAKELKSICEENNIKYFMLAGTLLGAIRHNGFIPWDDDMDFGMYRDDYNKFLSICEKKLNHDKFYIQRMEVDPGFGKFYTRLILKHTYLDYDYIKNVNSVKGLFIDIFPYDSIPNSKFLQKKQSMITSFALRLLKKKLNYGIVCHTIGGKIELLFEKLFTKKQCINIYNKEMQKYNYLSDSIYINCANAGYGYSKEILKRVWVENLQHYKFNDITLPGTIYYDEYLKKLYGDYMKIPPKEEQITHEFENIDFGPYKL